MSKARVIVLSVVHRGQTTAEAARKLDVSRQWVHTLVTRYNTGGLDAVEPRNFGPLELRGRTIGLALFFLGQGRGAVARLPSAMTRMVNWARNFMVGSPLRKGSWMRAFRSAAGWVNWSRSPAPTGCCRVPTRSVEVVGRRVGQVNQALMLRRSRSGNANRYLAGGQTAESQIKKKPPPNAAAMTRGSRSHSLSTPTRTNAW